MPVTEEPAFDPTRHQKVVKCSGKLLTCTAYLLIVGGAINAVANGLCALAAPAFADINFIDLDGQEISMHLDASGLFMLCMFKVLTGYLAYRQGWITLNLFKPILKDYREAESGRVQGIAMVKRLSKDMAELIRSIWKFTTGWHMIIWTFAIYTCYWTNEQADTYLELKYQYFQNVTHSIGVVDPVEDMPLMQNLTDWGAEDDFLLTDEDFVPADLLPSEQYEEIDNTKGDWWRDQFDMNNTWVIGDEPRKSKFQVYFPKVSTLMVTNIEQ